MNKFYYTYKITLLKGNLAGHYYFGQHRTNNLNDGYTGSGRIIRDYFKKYEKIEHQTYIKEILAFYNNADELNEAEDNLIGDKWKNDELCLNLTRGGVRENFVVNEDTKLKISQSVKKYFEELDDLTPFQKFKGKHHSEETKKRISEHHRTNYHPLTEETKNKIRKSSKGRHWKKDPETGKRIFYRND